MSEIKDLQPVEIWRNFYALTQIPRPSKKEAEIIAYMKKFGEDLGLETIVDEVGNVWKREYTHGYDRCTDNTDHCGKNC